MECLEYSLDSCETEVTRANNQIRLLGRNQTIIHNVVDEGKVIWLVSYRIEKDFIEPRRESYLQKLLPKEFRGYESIPMESDESIIRAASRVNWNWAIVDM